MAKKNKGMRNELATDAGSSDKAGKTKTRRRSTSSKGKTSAPRKRSTAQKPIPPTAAPLGLDPTEEQIQTRAYFISEHRRKLGLPGDEGHDWLTAERELMAELKV